MALKVLVLRSRLKTRQQELDGFMQRRTDLEAKAKEVEAAFNELNENSTDEERKAVEDQIDAIDADQEKNEQDIQSAQADIDKINGEIKDLENKPAPGQAA